MSPTEYDWHGTRSTSLTRLVRNAHVRLDAEGVRESFGEAERTSRTCIEGVHRIAAPQMARSGPRPFREIFEESCRPLRKNKIALALSGGIDSAVLAAMFRDCAVAYTLATPFEGYCEEREAVRIAQHLGVEIRVVHADEEDFVRALPDAIRACESPLYNLHPVSRYLLARAVHADGFDHLLTGDGADELFCDSNGADYLPIVCALGRGAGVTSVAPFCDPTLIPFVRVDPSKIELREFALSLGIPPEIAYAPKRARFAPRMNLDRYWDTAEIEMLGQSIGQKPSPISDRDYVGWVTLLLFARAFPGLIQSCAA